MYKFSIITPTFNRASYLPHIYYCLDKQGIDDIEWIIIDDGSSDETKTIIEQLPPSAHLAIKYIYQENAGKPSAVNKGVELAESYISIILDSDDVLLPNALETIWNYFDTITGYFIGDCVCVSGLSLDNNTGEIIGDKFPTNFFISDSIRCRRNMEISGDKCDFFVTGILKQYPFPLFPNEKFITEATVWNRIARNHKTLHINRALQKKEYLSGGLSDSGNLLDLQNPHGNELYYNESSTRPFKFILRLQNTQDYIKYAKINKQKHPFRWAKNKFLYPFALNPSLVKALVKTAEHFKNIKHRIKKQGVFASLIYYFRKILFYRRKDDT